MKSSPFNRRKFIRDTAAAAVGLVAIPSMAQGSGGPQSNRDEQVSGMEKKPATRIGFSVIGINHGHKGIGTNKFTADKHKLFRWYAEIT